MQKQTTIIQGDNMATVTSSPIHISGTVSEVNTQTAVTEGTIADRKGIVFSCEASEDTYKRLRTNIRKRFVDLIEAGTPLVTISTRGGNKPFDEYLTRVSLSEQNNYNCLCCRLFMAEVSEIGYINEDMTVSSPLQEAMADELVDYIPIRAKYVKPLVNISEALTNEEKNGWTHFYAFTKEEAMKLNVSLTAIDKNFVSQWLTTLKAPSMSSATLEKLTNYLTEKLYNPQPISLLHPLLKFVKRMENAAPGGLKAYDAIATHYRFNNWKWLLGVKSSSAGNVITFLERLTNGDASSLNSLVDQLNYQTDPERHKRTIREASEQALKIDVDKLKQLGVPRALERAMTLPSDITFDWTQHVPEEAVADDSSDENLSATEKIAKKLIGNIQEKKIPNAGLAFLNTQIDNSIVDLNVSLAQLKKLLPTYASIEFVAGQHLRNMFPVVMTKPVDDTDYSPIFGDDGGRNVQRVPVEPVSLRSLTENPPANQFIPLSAMYVNSNGAMVGQTDIGRSFMTRLIKENGTMVLGVDVKSSLKEHCRGWTDISKQLEVTNIDEPFFTGLAVSVGHNLRAVGLNGVRYAIRITSAE